MFGRNDRALRRRNRMSFDHAHLRGAPAETEAITHRPSSSRRRWNAFFSSAPGSGGSLSNAASCRCPSTERRMISVSSIVRLAASCAAATTKSLTDRPWISAARRTTASASGAILASNRAVRFWFCSSTSTNVRLDSVHVKPERSRLALNPPSPQQAPQNRQRHCPLLQGPVMEIMQAELPALRRLH